MSGYIFLSEGNDLEILSSDDDDDKFIIKYWIFIRNSQSNFWEYIIWLLTKSITKDYSHLIINETETTYIKKRYWGGYSFNSKISSW